jgi:hypothetical protein
MNASHTANRHQGGARRDGVKRLRPVDYSSFFCGTCRRVGFASRCSACREVVCVDQGSCHPGYSPRAYGIGRSEEGWTHIMKISSRDAGKLREVETLYKRIESFEPASDVEKRTRQLLLELARARRSELRRELARPHIKIRKKRAA